MGIGQQIINGTYNAPVAPPKTAFEELKAWCEKHLPPEEYKVVPESPMYYTTIYFDNSGTCLYLSFSDKGEYWGTGEVDEDEMICHIEDYELNKDTQ